MPLERTFADLGLTVLERGWLSSNNIVFRPRGGGPASVVDTGYHAHGAQTVSLLDAQVGPAGVAQVVNTHLHSDHCGGNRSIQERWGADTWVPAVSFDAVRTWDQSRLTYAATGQTCDRFEVHHPVEAGQSIRLGAESWEAIAAPGHDPESLMLFHRASRVLISADALWEARLSVIFPELDGRSGFTEALEVLDLIASLDPAVVIPGHGRPFTGVRAALEQSRSRLRQFQADPSRHARASARALAMFRMLEQRTSSRQALECWLQEAPVFARAASLVRGYPAASQVVDSLLADGLLRHQPDADTLWVA